MTVCAVRETWGVLQGHHYLGPTKAASFGWRDELGVMVFASPPRSRHLPQGWLELVRWCLTGGENAGSAQWARFVLWARKHAPATTVVSYSDPSQGHTGALYRACNWLWAPTWHRLRPPPTGNGAWTEDARQEVKDRWIFPLRPDAGRAASLTINDDALVRDMPWAEYREPQWSRGRPRLSTGGGDYLRWRGLQAKALQ